MKFKALSLSVALVSGLIFGSGAYAADSDVRQMAGILMHLNYFPTDAEKEALQAIAKSRQRSADVREVAVAMKGIRTSVDSAEHDRLETIAKNDSDEKELRDLADILANVKRSPSEANVAVLRDIVK